MWRLPRPKKSAGSVYSNIPLWLINGMKCHIYIDLKVVIYAFEWYELVIEMLAEEGGGIKNLNCF